MTTETVGIPQNEEFQRVREVLSHQNSIWLTDLDDTIKESRKYLWSDGKERKLLPETVVALLAIHYSGVNLGIATEQAFTQIKPFISDISQLAIGSAEPYAIFDGLIVGEGGSVVNSKDKGEIVLAPQRAREDVPKIVGWLWNNTAPSNIEGWSVLRGTNPEESTYVQLPPKEDVCIATASLWEKGPHVSEDPKYISKYKKIEEVVLQALDDLGITSLTTFEAGNGTLRIVPKFVNKAHSLELLAAYGLLNLNYATYSCDGPNDLLLAKKIKSKGGVVVAVSNAIAELHSMANISATMPAGKGFSEIVSLVFPKEYLKAKSELNQLKIT